MSTHWTIGAAFSAALSLGCIVWVMWRWLKASDEPGILILRWLVSFVVLGFVFKTAVQAKDEFAKIVAVLVGAVGGLAMTLIWRQKFCDFVGDLFASLYTGGNQAVEPTPFYSIAEAKRKRGLYDEALIAVQAQLERFPTDFKGWMLVAEIHAEDRKDLTSAEQAVETVLSQEGHAPRNIAFALNRLADWRLKLAQDREGARAALERIVSLLPDTEQAQNALQRVAHVTPEKMLIERHDRPLIAVPQRVDNIGLRSEPLDIKPPDEDPATTAGNYVKHLEEFPFDDEAREKLALIYARHYQRLDLATDQLQQLIATPNQPARQVAHWLNLLADLQLELSGDASLAREALERIAEIYPGSAAAENARHRIAFLKLELRPKQTSQVIKLGSYEQNLGLKGGPTGPPAPIA
jgi:tetratricopeptide (TPR) repeat protein